MSKRIFAMGALFGMLCATVCAADDTLLAKNTVVSGAVAVSPVAGGPKQVVGTNASGGAQTTTVDQNGQLSTSGASDPNKAKTAH